ncbi:hypothetical protein CCHL11_07916, partial [Colletotrichum chlorophyti]
MLSQVFHVVAWALAIGYVMDASQLPAHLVIRNSPGKTSSDTLQAIQRRLFKAKVEGQKSNTVLDKSFDDAVLFKLYVDLTENHDAPFHSAQAVEIDKANLATQTSIQVISTRCYLKGKANAHLTIDGTFNATKVANDIGNEFQETFDNITTYALNYISGISKKLAYGLDADDFDFPPLNIDFDVDIAEFPQARLGFDFEGLELFMQLETPLSSGLAYMLNLFTSTTPLGSKIGDDLLLGVAFSIDLILSVESDINISNGFHIRLDDKVGFDLALFSKNVTSLSFNGGQFEFLPVIMNSAGTILKAILRTGITAGIKTFSPVDSKEIVLFNKTVEVPEASSRIEVGVFASIAELSTNVTTLPVADKDGCLLQVANTYQFALGAAADWRPHLGPVPSIQIPIFYTTLAAECTSRRVTSTTLASVSASATMPKRDEKLTTTTLTEKSLADLEEVCRNGDAHHGRGIWCSSCFSDGDAGCCAECCGLWFGGPLVDLNKWRAASIHPWPLPLGRMRPISWQARLKCVDKKVVVGVSAGVGAVVLAGII